MMHIIANITLLFLLGFATIRLAVRLTETYEAAKRGEPQDLWEEDRK